MRVEITEDRLSDEDPETGRHYAIVKGDSVEVPDSVGKRWCGHGWAKDAAGNVPTGERIVRGATVRPSSARHAATDSNPAED